MNLSHAGRKDLTTVSLAPGNVGAATTQGVPVDMAGWDRVRFTLLVGAAATGAYDLRAVHSANANMSGNVNVTGGAITQIANINAVPNTVYEIDIARPTNRYVTVLSTTAAAANVTVLATRYRGSGVLPATLPTNHQYVAVSG